MINLQTQRTPINILSLLDQVENLKQTCCVKMLYPKCDKRAAYGNLQKASSAQAAAAAWTSAGDSQSPRTLASKYCSQEVRIFNKAAKHFLTISYLQLAMLAQKCKSLSASAHSHMAIRASRKVARYSQLLNILHSARILSNLCGQCGSAVRTLLTRFMML